MRSRRLVRETATRGSGWEGVAVVLVVGNEEEVRVDCLLDLRAGFSSLVCLLLDFVFDTADGVGSHACAIREPRSPT